MMAIQAIQVERENLQKQIDENLDDPDTPDLQELELCYWKAQMELKDAYINNYDPKTNQVPYEKFGKE